MLVRLETCDYVLLNNGYQIIIFAFHNFAGFQKLSRHHFRADQTFTSLLFQEGATHYKTLH